MSPPPNTPQELVIQLRAEMARQGLSIADVARKMGTNPRSEQHRFSNPSRMNIGHALKIASTLGVPFSTIARRAEHESKAAA